MLINSFFTLMQNLTPSEKRYYLLYAQLYSSKSQTSNHIILFKAINKYNITSQEALKKHFREQAIYKKMAQVKSYLYEDILDCLVIYHRKSLDKDNGSFSFLKNKILLKKKLYDEVLKNTEKLANKNEANTFFLDALTHKSLAVSTIHANRVFSPKLAQQTVQFCEKKVILSKKILEFNEYELLYFKLMQICNEREKSRKEIKEEYLTILKSHPLLQESYKIQNIHSYSLYVSCLDRIARFTKIGKDNTIKITEGLYKKVSDLEINNEVKHATLYRICITLILLYQNTQDKANFLRLRDLVEQHYLKQNTFDKFNFLFLKYQTSLSFAFETKDPEIGILLSDEILNFIDTYENMSDGEQIYLYTQLTFCWWGMHNYRKVAEILNKYLIFRKIEKHVENYVETRILYTIAQIELKNFSIAKSECRSLLYIGKTNPDWEAYIKYQDFIPKLYALIDALITENKVKMRKKHQEVYDMIEEKSKVNPLVQYQLILQWLERLLK